LSTQEERDFEEAMNKLFTAKWNIPKASEFLQMEPNSESWETLKVSFREYCLKVKWP
jgi:hypothetical protein